MNTSGDPVAPTLTRDDAIANDLERRIEQLLTLDDASLGSFGLIDWLVLVIGAVVLPVIAFVLAA